MVESVHRVLAGRTTATGAVSAGAAFAPADFLRSLAARGVLGLSR